MMGPGGGAESRSGEAARPLGRGAFERAGDCPVRWTAPGMSGTVAHVR